jgi:hypothetical protein
MTQMRQEQLVMLQKAMKTQNWQMKRLTKIILFLLLQGELLNTEIVKPIVTPILKQEID